MKKNVIVLLMCLASIVGVKAQVTDFPLEQNFENGLGDWLIESNDDEEADNFAIDVDYAGNHTLAATGGNGSVSYVPDEWLISPQMTLTDDMLLSFSAVSGYGGAVLDVYVGNGTTAAAYLSDQPAMHLVLGEQWNDSVLSLSAYAGQTVRIAFRYTHVTDGFSSVHIDNIVVRSTSLPVVTLPADTLTDVSMALYVTPTLVEGSVNGLSYTWTSAMVDAGQADMDTTGGILAIVYYTACLDTVTLVATNTYGTSTPAVMYVSVYDFQPAELPFYADFEEEDTAWLFFNGTNGWYIGEAAAADGERALYVSQDSGVTNTYNSSWSMSVSYAARALHVADAGSYSYSYNWHCGGSLGYLQSPADYMDLYLAPSLDGVSAGAMLPQGWRRLATVDMLNATDWQQATGQIDIDEPGTYFLVAVWNNDNYSLSPSDPAGAIDNISFAPMTCPMPINLSAYVDTTSVSLSWNDSDDVDSWLVSINGVDYESTDVNSYTFNDLVPGTLYTFYVRANCNGSASAAATVSGLTMCAELHAPWSENFEAYAAPVENGFNPCWSSGSSDFANFYTTRIRNTDNNNHLDFYYRSSFFGNDFSYVFLPPFADSVNTLQLSFDGRAVSEGTTSAIVVGVCDLDAYAFGQTFDPIDTIYFESTTWERHTVSFESYMGYGRHIGFFGIPVGQEDLYMLGFRTFIDNLEVIPIVDCERPTAVNVVEATDESLILSWNAVGAQAYEVGVRPADSEDDWMLVASIDTTVTIANLNPATLYDIRLRTVCSASDTSYPTLASARTLCSAVDEFPYAEGFETESALCWVTVNGNSVNGDNIAVTANPNWDTYSHSGSHSLYAGESTQGVVANEWALSPAFFIPLDAAPNLALSWFHHSPTDVYGTAYSPVLVLVNSGGSQTDTSAYTDTLAVVQNDEVWTKHSVVIGQYAGQAIHVAFVRKGGSSFVAIDDIAIDTMNILSVDIQADDVAIVGVANEMQAVVVDGLADSVVYRWQSSMMAAGMATVAYSDDSSTAYFTYLTDGIDTIQLVSQGLFGRDSTVAVVEVRDIQVADLPLVTGFEGDADAGQWLVAGTVDRWTVGEAIAHDGSRSLYVSDDDGLSNHASGGTTLVYRGVNFSTPGEYDFSFDWHYEGMGTLQIYLVSAKTDFVEGYQPSIYSDDFYLPLDGSEYGTDSDLSATGSEWRFYASTFIVNTPGVYALVMQWTSDSSDQPAAVDNLRLIKHSCNQPINLSLTAVTAHSLSLWWSGQADSYLVDYGTDSPIEATTTSCVISGLDAQTDYTVRVYSICSATDTSFPAVATFRTACAPFDSLPWIEDFDSYSVGAGEAALECWTHIGGGHADIGSRSVSGNSLRFAFSSNADTLPLMIALPEFAVGTDSLSVSLYATPTGADAGHLQVGYITSTVIFVPLLDLDAADATHYPTLGQFVLDSVDLAGAPADSRIAIVRKFGGNAFSHWFVDSLTVSRRAPQQPDDPGNHDGIGFGPDGMSVSLAPNPSSGVVAVAIGGECLDGGATLVVMDAMGRVVTMVSGVNGSTTIDLSACPAGTYFVRIATPAGTATRKLTLL